MVILRETLLSSWLVKELMTWIAASAVIVLIVEVIA